MSIQEKKISALKQDAATHLPTIWGDFRTLAFERTVECDGKIKTESALALMMGDLAEPNPLVRIHSQCVTGEVFGSMRCDCRPQLELAMRKIADEGRGILLYEFQEGRGIGLFAKLRAYALQDGGMDTVEANEKLGLGIDLRDYALPVAILQQLGVHSLRLLSNNPDKWEAVTRAGITVSEIVPCEVPPTKHSIHYMETKKCKLGHRLALV